MNNAITDLSVTCINSPNCSNEDATEREGGDLDVLTAKPQLKKPSKYVVIMYNDDYTPMDFVVHILMSEFKRSEDEAVQVMLNIHNQGTGVAGIYTKEIAETKASKVNSMARTEGYPLMTQIEPE